MYYGTRTERAPFRTGYDLGCCRQFDGQRFRRPEDRRPTRDMKIAVLVLFSSVAICQAQMIPDAKADTTVSNPAYKTVHPELAIDQAHGNIHTKDGLFKPFAQLAGNDGYHVVANVNSFTKDSLKGIDVLVISNPLGDLSNDNNNSTPAFTQAEC